MSIMHAGDAVACWPALIALADARRIYAQLFHVADIVGSAYGAAACDRALRMHTAVSMWQDVRRAVRAALRPLLALRSRLEAAARRERPDGFDEQPVTVLYFGSDRP